VTSPSFPSSFNRWVLVGIELGLAGLLPLEFAKDMVKHLAVLLLWAEEDDFGVFIGPYTMPRRPKE
jgi:hypothetical protein